MLQYSEIRSGEQVGKRCPAVSASIAALRQHVRPQRVGRILTRAAHGFIQRGASGNVAIEERLGLDGWVPAHVKLISLSTSFKALPLLGRSPSGPGRTRRGEGLKLRIAACACAKRAYVGKLDEADGG